MRRRTERWAGLLVTLVVLVAVVAPAAPGGADGNEAPGAPLAFRSITAGGNHTCAITSSGQVKCWGSNGAGQLGLGDTVNRGDSGHEMGADLLPVDLGTGRTATAITAGNNHTCALLDNGTVKCWGDNSLGKLGVGDGNTRGDGAGEMGDSLPTVNLGTGRTATAVTAGSMHTCALLDNGTVKCWGDNASGQLGLGDTISRGASATSMGDNLPAISLGTGRTATAVTAGSTHTCALLDDATVKCWGANSNGQLGQSNLITRGDQANEMGDNLPAVQLGTGRTAAAVTASLTHTCALLDNATVKCWGYNTSGQLGLGDTSQHGAGVNSMGDFLPTVDLGTGRTATAITADGGAHSCALLDNATVKCWGNNGSGELGQGDTASRGDNANEMGDNLSAIQLGTGRTAIAVTAGAAHTCAILDDAALKCWGGNGAGQLGVGLVSTRGDNPGEMGDNLAAAALTGSGVTGTVASTAGPVLPGALVAVLRPADFSIAAGATAISDGRFSASVAPGQYYVYAIGSNADTTPGFLGPPTTISVSAGQLTAANPVLPASRGQITGTVTDTGGGAPLGGAWVLALDATTGATESAAQADATGQYTLGDLRPGNHFVAFLDPTGAHAPRFYPDAATLATATPVTVTAGASATADGTVPAQAVVGTGAAITGRVTDSVTNTRLGGVFVLAFRAGDLSFVRGAVTNSSGGYAHTLTPGAYKLLFIDPTGDHAPEWFDNQPATAPNGAAIVSAPAAVNAGVAPTTGTISGFITYSNGNPLQAAWAIAIGPHGVAGATSTIFSGFFKIAGLPVGTYRAAMAHPNSGAFEYWRDSPDYTGADVFVVHSGGDTPLDATIGP